MQDQDLVTAEQIATATGRSLRTIERWLSLGFMPAAPFIMHSGRRMWPVSVIADLQRPRLANRKQTLAGCECRG
jgi:hypothetical protein